jgi:hypothetical protein
LRPIVTKLGKVGGMDKFIKRAKFDVQWLIVARSVES